MKRRRNYNPNDKFKEYNRSQKLSLSDRRIEKGKDINRQQEAPKPPTNMYDLTGERLQINKLQNL